MIVFEPYNTWLTNYKIVQARMVHQYGMCGTESTENRQFGPHDHFNYYRPLFTQWRLAAGTAYTMHTLLVCTSYQRRSRKERCRFQLRIVYNGRFVFFASIRPCTKTSWIVGDHSLCCIFSILTAILFIIQGCSLCIVQPTPFPSALD